MTEQLTDYDSYWKEVIEFYFPRFLEFFFIQAYGEIDWTRPYEFLDTELQQLEPDAEIGRHLVDKVAKVWCNCDGASQDQSGIAIPSTAEFQQVLDSITSGE
ncbi:hypothetical protein [Nostoc sp.]|uniref:hypothetical protein n=1 Tax=Nostoc sp. TaxID=1180 RepID=UPI002FF726ED